jgi:hypothetical protein
MDIFAQIAVRIVQGQEAIIGPIAVQQAQLVSDLSIDWKAHSITILGSPQHAVDDLVAQYQDLFGQIAVETCKEAVAQLIHQIPADQQPKSLQ